MASRTMLVIAVLLLMLVPVMTNGLEVLAVRRSTFSAAADRTVRQAYELVVGRGSP